MRKLSKDPPEKERREYLKTVGALVAGLAIGGAAAWLGKPAERVEVPGATVTAPGVTETVTKTVTVQITPTPTTPTPVEKLVIGHITCVPYTDEAWGSALWDMAKGVEKEYNDKGIPVEILMAGVPPPEFDDAAFTMIEEGAELIFVPCLGHGPEVWTVAKARPDILCSTGGLGKGDVFPPGTPEEEMILPGNMAVHDIGYGLGLHHFLAGIAAAHMTKTGKLGHIGGIPYPSVAFQLYGWTAGAHYVNPEIDLSQQVWVGDWGDPAKGGEVARSMHEYGVDFIDLTADGTGMGAIAYAEKVGGLYTCGNNWIPLIDKYPGTVFYVDSLEPGVDLVLSAYIDALLDDTWKGKFGGQYMKVGYTPGRLPAYGPAVFNTRIVPDEVMALVEEAYKGIQAGTIDIDRLLEDAKKFWGEQW